MPPARRLTLLARRVLLTRQDRARLNLGEDMPALGAEIFVDGHRLLPVIVVDFDMGESLGDVVGIC